MSPQRRCWYSNDSWLEPGVSEPPSGLSLPTTHRLPETILVAVRPKQTWGYIMKCLTTLWSLAILLALGAGQTAGQYSWTKDAHNPVLAGGGAAAWNRYVGSPCVLYNTDSARYEMWFTGESGNPSPYNDFRPYSIGRAVSTDGINWKLDLSPVMTPTADTWDAHTIEGPMVIRESGAYKMWYTTFRTPTSPCYMGYATSPDGIHWTKYPGNPVMGPGTSAWEAGGPWSCCVMPVSPSGGYRAWYSAVDAGLIRGGIGYATSADGIVWVKDTVNNPVLSEAPGQWDDTEVGQPQIFHISGSIYYMWYAAFPSGLASRNVGLAMSSDGGVKWKKYSGNPVLKHSSDEWDGSFIACGTVLQIPGADTLVMWYEGLPARGPVQYIGRAVSPLLTWGVSEPVGSIPTEFRLFQNYPNPFNPGTIIKFEVPKASPVSLKVYDILGREVSVLVNERKEPGSYEVKFDGSNLASGVYLYRLRAGSFVQTKQLLLCR